MSASIKRARIQLAPTNQLNMWPNSFNIFIFSNRPPFFDGLVSCDKYQNEKSSKQFPVVIERNCLTTQFGGSILLQLSCDRIIKTINWNIIEFFHLKHSRISHASLSSTRSREIIIDLKCLVLEKGNLFLLLKKRLKKKPKLTFNMQMSSLVILPIFMQFSHAESSQEKLTPPSRNNDWLKFFSSRR